MIPFPEGTDLFFENQPFDVSNISIKMSLEQNRLSKTLKALLKFDISWNGIGRRPDGYPPILFHAAVATEPVVLNQLY
jgi:hypothetical protein